MKFLFINTFSSLSIHCKFALLTLTLYHWNLITALKNDKQRFLIQWCQGYDILQSEFHIKKMMLLDVDKLPRNLHFLNISKYPRMHNCVTEMCTREHISVIKWFTGGICATGLLRFASVQSDALVLNTNTDIQLKHDYGDELKRPLTIWTRYYHWVMYRNKWSVWIDVKCCTFAIISHFL